MDKKILSELGRVLGDLRFLIQKNRSQSYNFLEKNLLKRLNSSGKKVGNSLFQVFNQTI
ncbi:hypothetical protein LEP1GSC158_1428 [Leptospira interrogans serovar Zanoni str. LT2156]|uniref:Uncharacterized protein n=1 Tax=Leptospira interrogans serovar Zanoni str. LT2156 TaxID=1001601 RepID=M6HN01_LEPIR|nr:hypothetical protein LEP1GSC158_1428 [Leptospira interrogans serovar Zanoni str. LT2156]